MRAEPQFDAFANSYDEELNQALAATGEDKDYFASGRVRWLQGRLKKLSEQPQSILDYGCGTGDTCLLLQQAFGATSVVGLDVSAGSIEVARARHQSTACGFMTLADYAPKGTVDLVYCNGVFHHIARRGVRSCQYRLLFLLSQDLKAVSLPRRQHGEVSSGSTIRSAVPQAGEIEEPEFGNHRPADENASHDRSVKILPRKS